MDTLISYINSEINRLDMQKKEILKRISNVQMPKVTIDKIDFSSLALEEKHLVAASYIKRILVKKNEMEIEWKV